MAASIASMDVIKAGQRVRVRLARDSRNRGVTCTQHRGGVETDGLIGQVVALRPGLDHGISLQFDVWDHGTPWIDSYRADELEPEHAF
jgi:hypothetical protein